MYNQIASNKRKSVALVLIFILFVVGLGYVYGAVTRSGYVGMGFALVLSLGMALVSYFAGDKIALATAGARPIEKKDNAELVRLIENLSITQGFPTPKIFIIPDAAINAFATGRDPVHASVAVTTGALEKLDRQELEGVLAHELSHVKNFDIRLMTLVIVLVGIVSLVAGMMRNMFYLGGRRDNRDRDQLGGILMVVGLVMSILAPLFATLIQLAVSRRREYLADASGALLTRYPEGLARALEKIGREGQPLRAANDATAHLYIASPWGRAAHLFSTHPPLEERIKRLREMIV